MSEWLTLERLPHNDLPLPQYATNSSAGADFAACLTRPCKAVIPGNIKHDFMLDYGSKRKHFDELDQTPDPIQDPTLIVSPGETVMVPLGFKCEFHDVYVLHLHVRSSIGLTGFLLANGTGIVDPDYRGELFACLYNRTNTPLPIKHGQRIVQGVLVEHSRPIIRESKVNETMRGEHGFGSTGTMIQEQAKDLPPESKPAKA